MEHSSSGQPDEASEYGSDFTPDEEEILKGFLQEPSRLGIADNPIRDLELQLEDVEDNEGPYGVKLPHWIQHAVHPSERRHDTKMASQQPSAQLNNLTDVSTNGKCRPCCLCGH